MKRRGGRMRRRRRVVMVLVTTLALALPVSAVAGLLGGPGDPGVEMNVAGPAPSGERPQTSVPGLLDPAAPTDTTIPDVAGPPGGSSTTTTTVEVHQRVSSVNGVVAPPTDEPVVRTTTTSTPTASATGGGGGTAVESPTTSSSLPTVTTLPPGLCTATDVIVTFGVAKDTYRAGETVQGDANLDRRAGATCALPFFDRFQILDGANRDVLDAGAGIETFGSSQTDFGGATPYDRNSFKWEALDCRPQQLSPIVRAPGDRTGCVPFPPGTYTVIARWQNSGISARGTFAMTV